MPSILVVDDEEAIASYIARVLMGKGFAVRTVRSAELALEACEQNPFDILLSDIVMPGGMDGLELAELVEKTWPATTILLMTGYAGPGRSSNWPVLHKPFTPRTLTDHIWLHSAEHSQISGPKVNA